MDEFKEKSMLATFEIIKAYKDPSQNRPWQVGYSGGKDSTVVVAEIFKAVLALPREQRTRKIYIVTSQTHLDFVTDPLKQSEFKKMQRLIDDNDLPIEIMEVEANLRNTFIYLTLGKGYPLPKSKINRWCTGRIKIDPATKAMKKIDPVLIILGVRKSESAARKASIESHQTSEYYSDNVFMPIVNFTLEDVWDYLAKNGMPWGNAEELSQVYKDATGECGLSKRKAGADEKVDDPCGARTGCIVCPVVTIDKSSQEFAKSHPWLQPYVELRNIVIEMYKNPKNKAGRMRNGLVLQYGQGTFTVKARMKLYGIIKQAEEDNRYLALLHGTEPQKLIYNELLDQMIKKQWETDLIECPWVEDAEVLGQFYLENDQYTWNHEFESVV